MDVPLGTIPSGRVSVKTGDFDFPLALIERLR
jgi:hypothetical protein